ncbi:hypothetical protein BpHYR1_016329 [Brachionus plicatilis]|uniref:Uncharacterized protein n=1 Tax=Brachionus plicatilis TaxID=10195 RepID=A0A3M7STM8_BRAPC|nr:hypothetical protein BpHYR1_016329 [Brachionus plicatilis]
MSRPASSTARAVLGTLLAYIGISHVTCCRQAEAKCMYSVGCQSICRDHTTNSQCTLESCV